MATCGKSSVGVGYSRRVENLNGNKTTPSPALSDDDESRGRMPGMIWSSASHRGLRYAKKCGPKPVRFLLFTCLALSPAMSEQKTLLSFLPPPSGTVYVNAHVCFRTEGTERVISVHGVVF